MLQTRRVSIVQYIQTGLATTIRLAICETRGARAKPGPPPKAAARAAVGGPSSGPYEGGPGRRRDTLLTPGRRPGSAPGSRDDAMCPPVSHGCDCTCCADVSGYVISLYFFDSFSKNTLCNPISIFSGEIY